MRTPWVNSSWRAAATQERLAGGVPELGGLHRDVMGSRHKMTPMEAQHVRDPSSNPSTQLSHRESHQVRAGDCVAVTVVSGSARTKSQKQGGRLRRPSVHFLCPRGAIPEVTSGGDFRLPSFSTLECAEQCAPSPPASSEPQTQPHSRVLLALSRGDGSQGLGRVPVPSLPPLCSVPCTRPVEFHLKIFFHEPGSLRDP